METGGISAVQVILVILAANALIILLIYGLVVLLRKKTEDILQQVSQETEGYSDQVKELNRSLSAYAGIDQEPYFTPLEALQTEIAGLEERLRHLLAVKEDFEGAIRSPGENQLSRIVNAPFLWFRHWRGSTVLREESRAIAAEVADAEKRMETIYRLPWELAAECRQAEKEATELSETVEWLQERAARGAVFAKVVSQVPMLQRELNGVPAIFLRAGPEELLANASLDDTIRVFKVLGTVRPPLNRYLPQVREWRKHYEKASADYAELKQFGARLRQTMMSPPAGLVVTPLQNRLDQVAQMAGDLNQRLAQPEVDELKHMAREANRMLRIIQDTEVQYIRAGQQAAELAHSLEDLEEGLGRLSGQVAALERSDNFPLVWDVSRGRLDDLRQHLNALGPADRPRTPDEITAHIREVEAIREQHNALAEQVPAVAAQHGSLVSLLISPEIREGETWLRRSQEALAQIALYDPRNWPKQDAIQDLPDQLETLKTLHRRLVPDSAASPIHESGLAQRLKDTQALAAQHKMLRARMDSALSRLEQIRGMEKEGKDRLTASWNALERAALLCESNDFLNQVAAQEIDRLGEEIRQLGNELNNHGQGEIEKKAQKITAQSEKVLRSLQAWLAQQNTAIADQGRKISSLLVQLDVIARLSDGPVEEARGLVSRDDFIQAARVAPGGQNPAGRAASSAAQHLVGRVARIAQSGSKGNPDELSVTAELKHSNDLWQMVTTTYTALAELCEPVFAAYKETDKARTEARQSLAEVSRSIPDKRAWPPSNQSPLEESRILRPVDEKLEALKARPVRADWVAQELGRLAHQYSLVTERARQVIDRVQQDQERILDLETQVEALKQRWQSQSDPANVVMRTGIQQLMSQADSRLAYIKQQYMRGILSYEEVIHNLQLLYDDLFAARIPVDEQNEVGINEPRHRTGPV